MFFNFMAAVTICSDFGAQNSTDIWNLKYNTNKHTCEQKQTYRHRKQICGCQGEGRVREGESGSFGLADAKYDV